MRHFDTARIQAALNSWRSGQAMELQAANGNDAFQFSRLPNTGGRHFLIDPGVTVYASLNPRDYDIASGSCGIVAAMQRGMQATHRSQRR